MKVCIAPWGDPLRWGFASYCLEDNTSVCEEGFTSAPLLLRHLKCDRLFIVVLDTLTPTIETDYRAVEQKVKEYVKKYLCLDSDNVEILVYPGIMVRKIDNSIVEFWGSMTDAMHKMVYDIFFELSRENPSKLEVILDTSHGINYFTLLTRESVVHGSALLSTALGIEVRVEMFNSDPYSVLDEDTRKKLNRDRKDPCRPLFSVESEHQKVEIPRLRLNRISSQILYPWDLVRYLRYGSEEKVKKVLTDIRGCDLDESELRDLTTFAKKVVATFRVGAAIELLHLVKDNDKYVDSLRDLLHKTVCCWYKGFSIEDHNGRKIAIFKKRFSEGFTLLLHAHSIAIGVKKVLNQDKYITLKHVEKILNQLFKGSETTRALAKVEVSKIKNLDKNKKIHKDRWEIYKNLRRETGKDICLHFTPSEVGIIKRDFIAHAGFHTHFIELKKEENDIALKIRENCIETINTILENLFKDLSTT